MGKSGEAILKSIFARALVGGLVMFGLSACGPPKTLYDWNGYNRELLAYYKSPAEQAKFAEKLFEDIEKAELTDTVPPGLYAEYGYIVMQMGETQTAIVYFTKERDRWPEARYLMDSVIKRLGGGSPATDPASTEEPAGGAGQ
jgi:hypothetical protein